MLRAALPALLAALVLPVVPVVLAAAVLAAVAGRGAVAAASGSVVVAVPLVSFTPGMWAVAAVFCAASLYAVGTALTAGVVVAAGPLVGRRVTAGAALRAAARRPWAMVLCSAAVPAAGAAAWPFTETVWGVTRALSVDADPPHIAVAATAAVVAVPPAACAGAVAALSGSGPLRTAAGAARMLAGVRIGHACHLLAVAAVAVPLVWSLPRLAQQLAMTGAAALAVVGVLQAAVAVCAAAALVADVTALVVGCRPARPAGARRGRAAYALDPDAVRSLLPAERTGRRRSPGPALGTAAGFAAVLLLPAMLWARPDILPAYSVQAVETPEGSPGLGSHEASIRAVPGPGGTVVFGDRYSDSVLWCAPECREALDGPFTDGSEFLRADTPSGFLQVRWSGGRLRASEPCPVDPSEEEPGTEAATCADRGTVLRTDAALVAEGDADGGAPGSDGAFEPVVAVAAAEDGPVVVSMAATPDERGLDTRLHRCADAACADHEEADLGTLPMFDADAMALGHANAMDVVGRDRPADIAVRPDGSAVVGVYDPYGVSTTVLSCTDARCTGHERHVVEPPARGIDYRRVDDESDGVRVAVRPDGRPVVVHRRAPDNSIRLADCADRACAQSRSRRLIGLRGEEPDWSAPPEPVGNGLVAAAGRWGAHNGNRLPDLAIDGRGRPRLVGLDATRQGLVLLSCRDTGCADVSSVPLRADGYPGFASAAFTLDAADRPVIAVRSAPRPKDTDDEYAIEAPLTLLTCTRPACGATP